MNNRVVIQVYGGVADEVIHLAKGAVETVIVDFDDLEACDADQLQSLLESYSQDVREWVQKELS